jgi:hypothetical protein
MISFTLHCDKEHEFDAWFRSSADYDDQAKGGLLACPVCGSAAVTKGLMAPNVAPKGNRAGPPERAPHAVLADPKRVEIVQQMRKLRTRLLESSEYVGGKFAEEARRIHYDDAERRGIHGEASVEEARELLDEGIDVFALPGLPEDEN